MELGSGILLDLETDLVVTPRAIVYDSADGAIESIWDALVGLLRATGRATLLLVDAAEGVRTIPLTVAVKDRTTLAPLICSAPPEDQVIRLGYCLSQDPLSLGVHCPRCVVFVYASPADGRPTRCLLETTHDEWFDLASDGASLVPVWGDRPIHVRSLVF